MSGTTYEVTLAGEVDLGRKDDLAAYAAEFEASHAENARVDMSAVTFFDSTGLSFLVGLRRTAETRQGHVELIGVSPTIQRLLHLVDLEDRFRLTDTPETGSPA